jgi:carbohydrate-selective porin OprB
MQLDGSCVRPVIKFGSQNANSNGKVCLSHLKHSAAYYMSYVCLKINTSESSSIPSKESSALVRRMAIAGIICAPIISAYGDAGESSMSPVITTNEPSFWNQQYMLGDWGGLRSRLADRGVTFDFNDIGDLQTDVSGSQEHRFIYFGRFRSSADIDFNKLASFDGEFFISAICQYGQNLSGDYLHVNTLTSSIAGVQSERID